MKEVKLDDANSLKCVVERVCMQDISYDVCLFVKNFVINTYAMNVCTKCVHLWAVQIMKTKYLLISTWDIFFFLHTENICKKPYASVYSTSGWCENILFLVCPEFCRFPFPPHHASPITCFPHPKYSLPIFVLLWLLFLPFFTFVLKTLQWNVVPLSFPI